MDKVDKKYLKIIYAYVGKIMAGKRDNLAIFQFVTTLPTNFYRGMFWRIWNHKDTKASAKWYLSKERNKYLILNSLSCTAIGIDDKLWKKQCDDLHTILYYKVV